MNGVVEDYFPPYTERLAPSQIWRLLNYIRIFGKDNSLWSMDLFRCDSILLQSFWVMVTIGVFTRRFIGFAVERGDIDGVAVCRMFNSAIARQGLPKYLSTDNDPLDIEEIKAVPFLPRSHPFVERIIRTIREDLLDQVLFWNQLDLERKLAAFRVYYNRYRVHSGIEGLPPDEQGGQCKRLLPLSGFRWTSHCHGLFQLPAAA